MFCPACRDDGAGRQGRDLCHEQTSIFFRCRVAAGCLGLGLTGAPSGDGGLRGLPLNGICLWRKLTCAMDDLTTRGSTMRSPLRRCIGRLAGALLICSTLGSSPTRARTILFVGNSFTFGENSPVKRFHPERVVDLNSEGIGGVPALFKTFADEARLNWTVSLETSPGKDLAWHVANKRAVIDRSWDVVILQGYSTLDAARPGDPTRHVAAAHTLASLFHLRNPQVQVDLVATWSRADLTYRPAGHWYNKPITQMADDLLDVSRQATANGSDLHVVVPVGTAWNRAMRDGVADPNPYDGIDFGKVSLWAWDQYHASAEGYYLEALVVFGTVTGLDPRTLGDKEHAAVDLGLDPKVAAQLREIAAAELSAQRHSH